MERKFETNSPKFQMGLLCRSPRLLYLATSVCIRNRRHKKRNVPKEKKSFFATSKLWKESLKTIHQKYKICPFPPCVHFFSICCVAKMKGSNFELICLKNRAWAHVGGGGAQFFCPKVQEKNGQKMQMNSFFRFL